VARRAGAAGRHGDQGAAGGHGAAERRLGELRCGEKARGNGDLMDLGISLDFNINGEQRLDSLVKGRCEWHSLPEVRGLSHPAKLEKMQRLPRSIVEVVQRHSGSEKCCHAQPARQCGDLLHCHCGSWAVPLVGDGIPSDTGVEEQCSGSESPVGDLVFF
jgi:hypothetical protein